MEPQRRSGNEGLPGDVVIGTPDRRLRVFVSSTLGEMTEERRAVSRAISAMWLTPVMFEVGARPHPPQESDRLEQVRQALGAGCFKELFAAGTRLSQREAVAAVRADAASTDARGVELNAMRTEQVDS